MAQADSASIPQRYTVQEATAQIVALINSSPHSPWPSEIEAIVARVVSPSADQPALVSHMSEDWWRALHAERAALAQHRREYLALKASGREQTAEEGKRSDAEAEAICAKTEAATVAVWQAGAKTWADIVLFAEVARYWMWDPEDPSLNAGFYNCLDIHDTGLDTQALAQLVNAVLQIAGKEARS